MALEVVKHEVRKLLRRVESVGVNENPSGIKPVLQEADLYIQYAKTFRQEGKFREEEKIYERLARVLKDYLRAISSPEMRRVGNPKMKKFVIEDWTGKLLFKGKVFSSFEDAEEFLSEKLGKYYDTDRQEYEIIEIIKTKQNPKHYRKKHPKGCHHGRSTEVQSLIFDKRVFTLRQAQAWARAHGYYHGEPDETVHTWRIRQFDPTGCRVLRMVHFARGIEAVVAR